jgi:hypothetical protein
MTLGFVIGIVGGGLSLALAASGGSDTAVGLAAFVASQVIAVKIYRTARRRK